MPIELKTIQSPAALTPQSGGFTAAIAVVLLASGSLAMSLAAFSAASEYSDSVMRHESRIRARLDLKGCIDTVSLMAAKDYFMQGRYVLSQFRCAASVDNDFSGNIKISATTTEGSITATGSSALAIRL